MKLVNTIAATVLVGLAACSGGENGETSQAPESTETTGEPAASIDDITPEYLAGEWCYARMEFPNEVSQENITYDFAADGTLKYQNNPEMPVDSEGSYEKEDGKLVIKPALMFLKFTPVSVSENEMVLEAMGGNAIWTRGACES
jgi:hypothetical protein